MQTLVGTHGGCFFVPLVGTWRQDDQVSKVILGYLVNLRLHQRPCLRKERKKRRKRKIAISVSLLQLCQFEDNKHAIQA